MTVISTCSEPAIFRGSIAPRQTLTLNVGARLAGKRRGRGVCVLTGDGNMVDIILTPDWSASHRSRSGGPRVTRQLNSSWRGSMTLQGQRYDRILTRLPTASDPLAERNGGLIHAYALLRLTPVVA